ncbi:MAG: Asp23/Gls24 family envelope stress response protein [Bacillota bacterium]
MEKQSKVFLPEGSKNLGQIDISTETIATLAGIVATQCYGVVGMASLTFQDGIASLLHRDNLSKGVEIITNEDFTIVNLYIVVQYGIKINEVALNVINAVKYALENQLSINIEQVNVIVQGVHFEAE